LSGTGKTKISLEFAELLQNIPQLMVASGSNTKAEKEIEAIKKTIDEIGYAVYAWKPAGKAKDINPPFILWVYDSDKEDGQYYQRVPYGLLIVKKASKEEISKEWEKGAKWIENAYPTENINEYLNKHEIFFKVTKVIECNESISKFKDKETHRKLSTNDATRMQNGYLVIEAPKKYLKNYIFLSVRPDWRDSKQLLGYYNPLDNKYYKTPLLELILKATEDYKENKENASPYFVILDEMNLAHVEYYFADFLSVLESGRDEEGFTREGIKLHNVDEIETNQKSLKKLNSHQISTS
jgi:5-methylcytosine-specific restriction endonuclease McrBC GTP-binding regulatory subunit McrB